MPSAWVGVSRTSTGFYGSRNLGVTAALDFGFQPWKGLLPALEVRGTHPVAQGIVVGQQHAEAGLRLEKPYGPLRPYADLLLGRGKMSFQKPGFVVLEQRLLYPEIAGNVLSPGLGVAVDLSPQVAVLFDAQAQRWTVPFDPSRQSPNSGHITSLSATLGAVYRFGWLHHGHPYP